MGEIIWQLRRGGVISVWRCYPGESTLLDELYMGIVNKSKVFEGLEFKRHNWVDVPDPFDLDVFSRRLFLNFHSSDLRAKEILASAAIDDTRVIQGCHKFLHEDRCLIVINGLKSTDDWNLIKSAILSEHTKCCILVTATKESVAKYCVVNDNRALDYKELYADAVLHQLIKGSKYYGIEDGEASSRGHFFSHRRKEARDWMDKFEFVVDPARRYSRLLRMCLEEHPGVISFCGATAAWKSAVVREIYYGQMLVASEDNMPPKHDTNVPKIVDLEFTKYSWVGAPQPFDLIDLCLRLFLDFHSDDPKAKQTAAFDIMEGRQDPIEGCLKFLRQDKCLVVIDGLESMDDWDSIKDVLLSQPTKGCVLVITNEKCVATHCVHDEYLAVDVVDWYLVNLPLIKNKRYTDRERNRDFSSRMVKAREWTKKIELIGRDHDHYGVLEPLQYGGVISVWGMAGVGKSDLVRSIYNQYMIGLDDYARSVRLNKVTKYSWVDVPQSVNLTALSRHILMDFHSGGLEAQETAAFGMIEGQDPIQLCREILQQDICFLVIDGLRSTNDWDLVKEAFLPEPIKGVIAVITNKEGIARHCAHTKSEVANVRGLEAEAALNLFTKKVWGGKQLPSDMVELSRLTVTKCGGISKVIACLGDYCHGYETLKTLNASFISILENDPRLRDLFSWMQSYFDDCPDSLKPCIFYLSIFPSGNNIRRRRLLRRWIAEGYSRDTYGSTAEENVVKAFSALVELSIIQLHTPSKAGVCQVNGFFREYIISRPMQDNLVFALEGDCSLNSLHVGQHLTIGRSWDRANNLLLETMELSRVRSFTVFGEWRPFFISKDVNMRLLRVLDLEDTSDVTDRDLEHIGKLLPRLKFLSLRGCIRITRLSSSIGDLTELQTLDIKGTSIVFLPPTIIKLQKLQYIRAGTTHQISTSSEDCNGMVAGVATTAPVDSHRSSTSQPAVDDHGATTHGKEARMSTPWSSMTSGCLAKFNKRRFTSSDNDIVVQFPAAAAGGIGKLTALHTLGVVNVNGASGKVVLRELMNLVQLRKLKLSGINSKNWLDFCDTISGHGYLESLSARLDDENDRVCCLDDISETPKTIRTLKLYGGNVHVSSTWMKQLSGLKDADIGDLKLTVSTQEDIDSLMRVPCQEAFHHVRLKPTQDGELRYGWWQSWSFGEGFLATKALHIDCGSYRLSIVFGPELPKHVELLVVYCSTTGASLQISDLHSLVSLKEVRLKGSYSEGVKQHLQQKVAELLPESTLVLKLE